MRDLDWVAVYGAALATVLALREWNRDRWSLRFYLDGDYPEATDEDIQVGNYGPMYWRLRVTNVGKRPVNVVQVGLLGHIDYWLASEDVLWASDSIHRLTLSKTAPVLLAEGDSLDAGMEEHDLVSRLMFRPNGPERVVGAYAVDTTGRRFDTHTGKWGGEVVGPQEIAMYLRDTPPTYQSLRWVTALRAIRRLAYLLRYRVRLP